VTKGRLLFFSFLLVLSVVLAFIYYNNFYYPSMAAQDLAHAYTKDEISANKEFLNKRLNLLGEVKAYYSVIDSKPVLELQTYHGDLPVICFFTNDEDEYKANQFKEGQDVSVKCRCLGTNPYSSIKGVKVEVDGINSQ
jgi:tRNA_anti-like